MTMLKRLLPKEFRATLAWLLCVHALGLLLLAMSLIFILIIHVIAKRGAKAHG